MCLSLVFPASALFADEHATVKVDTPVIYIAGDSINLGYDNDSKMFCIDTFFDLFKSGASDTSTVVQTAASILAPMILKGVIFDEWDDYYDAVYNEIYDATKPVLLDKNGDVCTDCGVRSWEKKEMDYDRTHDVGAVNGDGLYGEMDYQFYYDWRLDPLEIVDELHSYVQDIKAVTGKDKVCIEAKCLGCNVLLAYLYKYGTEDLKGVALNVPTSLGADFLDGVLNGELGIDGNAIGRFLTSEAYAGSKDTVLAEFLDSVLSVLEDSGVFDGMSDTFRKVLYSKIEYGVFSAVARSTLLTFPGYWGMVGYDAFDGALNYIYGNEGSELRNEYAGMIDKISFFNENIKKNALSIFGSLKDAGVNVAVISKYGIQLAPVIKDGNVLADEYVSVSRSSLGATTADVYGTLSDEYIAERTAQGYGKYISPDKKIDASTCLFPESTWFVKGNTHAFDSHDEGNIMVTVMAADKQLTVDDFELGRFVVYHQDIDVSENMTESNCGKDYLGADYAEDKPGTLSEKKESRLKNIFRFVKALILFLVYNVFPKLINKA
ncbi:MAG: hypothetical protein MJ177_05235 [Clostridia bacterium]|nr:hypothetical protein [Clostridia bacterium]